MALQGYALARGGGKTGKGVLKRHILKENFFICTKVHKIAVVFAVVTVTNKKQQLYYLEHMRRWGRKLKLAFVSVFKTLASQSHGRSISAIS